MLEEIRDKKLTCVVHTKSSAEAEALAEYLPWGNWQRKPFKWWGCYAEQTGYYIENGELSQVSPIGFWEDEYPRYGEIYEFSDLVATPTLSEIKEKKMTCVIHTPTKEDAASVTSKIPSSRLRTSSDEWLNFWNEYKEHTCYCITDGGIDSYCDKEWFENHNDENGNSYIIYEFSDLFAADGRHKPMRITFENGSSIEALPQKDDVVRGKNHFCNGFRGSNKIEYVLNEEHAKKFKKYLDSITAVSELISDMTGISYEDSIDKSKEWLSTLLNDGISAKNGGKNSMKFTFYVVAE